MIRWLCFGLFMIALLKAEAQFQQGTERQGPAFDSSGVSRDSSDVSFTDLDVTERGNPNMQRKSYSLDRFQQYLPVYSTQIINATLGNNGTAMQPWILSPVFRRGFHWGFNTFEPYFLPAEQVRVYDAKSPFTQASYAQGSQEENYFHLIHTQNAGKALNTGVEYKRINSQGFYVRQRAAHTALRFHVWLRPEKSRYQLIAALHYHRGIVQENGGLTAFGDSLFRTNTENNRRLYPVSLQSARNQQFRNGVLLRQTYDLLGAKRDSTSRGKGGILRLQHTAGYDFYRHLYDDPTPDTAFYPQIFQGNRNNTAWIQRRLNNEIALLKLEGIPDSLNRFQLGFKAFIRQQYVELFTEHYGMLDSLNLRSLNQSAGGFVRLQATNWRLSASAEVFFAGFNAGDSQIEGRLELGKSGKNTLTLALESHLQEVDYQLQFFSSNFSYWNEDFSKQSLLSLGATYSDAKDRWSLFVRNRVMGNLVILDSTGRPEQIGQAQNVLSAGALHKLRLGRFHLHSQVLAQVASNTSVIRLPALQFQENLFWETAFKRSKTILRIGVDLMGCTAFTAYGYQPWSGLFYRSTQGPNQGLLQADFYLSARIRRARVFIKLEHFNSSFGEQTFMLTPGYAIHDRALKLGLNWTFFD